MSGLLLCLLIVGESEISFIWRFLLSFCVGGILGGFYFVLWKSFFYNRIVFKIDVTLTILSIILTIISAVLPGEDIIFNLENSYPNSSNIININDCFRNSNSVNHCYIFMLDKTMDTKYNPKFSSVLKNKYDLYVEIIRKDGYSNFPKKGQNITYVDFCRAKLCVDLLKLHKNGALGYFQIYTFDEDTSPLFPNELEIAVYDNIRWSIISLLSDTLNIGRETESDFRDFYEKIDGRIQTDDDKYAYNQFSLYVYSDFVHDKKVNQNYSKNNFVKDTSSINRYQRKLLDKSILQNYYIVPSNIVGYKSNENLIAFILDNRTKKSIYKNIIPIENIAETSDEEVYHKTKYAEDVTFYYPIIDDECIPKLKFSKDKFWIKLTDENSLLPNQEVKILTSNGKERLNDNEFVKISKDTCSLFFTGSCPSKEQTIYLDIANRQGTHNIVRILFINSYSAICKYLLPIFLFLTSLFLVIAIFASSNKKVNC